MQDSRVEIIQSVAEVRQEVDSEWVDEYVEEPDAKANGEPSTDNRLWSLELRTRAASIWEAVEAPYKATVDAEKSECWSGLWQVDFRPEQCVHGEEKVPCEMN